MASFPVVALEMGTSKVRALVGEEREDGYLMVIGVGEAPSRGVRKGEIMDFENALACAESVLTLAEEQSKVSINYVNMVITGGHIRSVINRGTVPVLEAEGEITEEAIERVSEMARAISLPNDRDVLHTIHQQFYVDDQEGVVNPEGMVGARLTASMLIMHGVRNRVVTFQKLAQSAKVDVDSCAFSGLCAALAVLTPEQKESGCVVLDLGAGTTDYVVYADRCIAAAGCIAVGGDHITNDLAMVLNIPLQQSEKLKIDVGVNADKAAFEQPVIIPPSGGFSGRSVRLRDVYDIIDARLDELLDMIMADIERHGLKKQLGAGVVLTGGGAYMKNVVPYIGDKWHMPCAIGRPKNVSGIAVATEGPEFAATIGMLRYALRHSDESSRQGLKGFFTRLFGR
jgi:cell division protein FtsA